MNWMNLLGNGICANLIGGIWRLLGLLRTVWAKIHRSMGDIPLCILFLKNIKALRPMKLC